MNPRHTSETIAEARRLHDGGFTCYRIALIFRRRGVKVDQTTIAEWVDPKMAERRRKDQRERMRRLNAQRCGGRLGAGPPRSPEFKLARIVSLHELGVSYLAIAKTMTFDFPGQAITEHQVKYAVKTGSVPKPMREKAAA